MPHKATWGSPWVCQEAEVAEESVAWSLFCGFWRQRAEPGQASANELKIGELALSAGSGAIGVCSSCLIPALEWCRAGEYWLGMRELGKGSDGKDGPRAGWCVRDRCALQACLRVFRK